MNPRLNLPNYFLADLPPETTFSATMVREACQTLKSNRERYLAGRSTRNLINILGNIARSWLETDYPFRKLALEQGPAATGFSRATLANGLDLFFKQLTEENLYGLLEQDLGHRERLDELSSTEVESKFNRAAIATAPDLVAHVTAGNLPNPALLNIALGVLARSAQFVKCASGATLLPRLFAHSLYQVEPKLGACLEIAEWRGGNAELEAALFDEADCVTATGSNETLAAIRERMPAKTRFLAYAHRVSFAYVTSGVLSGLNARKVVARAATDVVAWDQLGCLSPHVIYVEHGGGVSAEQFAEALGEELARREQSEPRGDLLVAAAAAIASRRAFYEMRATHTDHTRLWGSKDSTAWTVIYEADPRFQLSCLYRFIYVKGVTNLPDALQNADSVRDQISTVGLAAPEDKAQGLATELARWGVTRVCPLGHMQDPPLTWRHDGRPVLGDLVRWTDWEID